MQKIFLALAALTVASLNAAPAQENWDNSCASCHATNGKADTKIGKKLKIRDYTDKAVLANTSDEQLTKAIKDGVIENGKERMKGYSAEYSDEEIGALVKLTRSFAK